MPVAFSTLAFPDASLAAAAALGRDCGYDGIELRLIDGEFIDPLMPAPARSDVKRTLAMAGLPVVAVDTSIRLVDPGQCENLRGFLELASDLECPLVRVFGGALPGPVRRRRAVLESAARALEAHAPLAERLGVAIGVETHDSFSSSSVLAELLGLVDSASVGAVWDSHHPYRLGESPEQVYASVGHRLLLAQVKDAKRAPDRADGWRLVLLGEGEVPVREMLGLLRAGGYRGPVSVEWEKRWHPEIESPERALPQYLAVLRMWLGQAEPGSGKNVG